MCLILLGSLRYLYGSRYIFPLLMMYTSFVVQFVEKAPEDIVRGVREKASEADEKISLTKNRLAFLQSIIST